MIVATQRLVVVTCCACGTPFGIEETLQANLRATEREFYCPNGHRQWYGESEATRLKKDLKNAEQRVRWAESDAEGARYEAATVKLSLAATRGTLTKLKRRVANGVCPACHRTVGQLARHMANKHPGYQGEEETSGKVT